MFDSILVVGSVEAVKREVAQLLDRKVLALFAVVFAVMPFVLLVFVVFVGGVGAVVGVFVVAAAVEQHHIRHISISQRKL